MTNTPSFEGRVAVVTGGSRGIGRATALALAGAGADVVVHYRRDVAAAEGLAQELRALGGAVKLVGSDVRRKAAAPELIRQSLGWKGHIDIVVANAGIAEPGSLATADRASWSRTLETNLVGPFELAQAAEKALRRTRGAFISTASISGLVPSTTEIQYNASKAGLVMVTRCLALAMAPDVRVNAVAPGWVATDMTRAEQDDPVAYRRIRAATPLGRWGRPEDVAAAILFLASDLARFITGQILVVDGGQSLHWRVDEPAPR
ncbi:MAG TPA: SDR family NAD(P)-dependent oxidoreductase [Thermoplasmata archaeon]|nr:SDR family NAD(P)-dependent oxidoreductase [Thermoplasmata archaeon]